MSANPFSMIYDALWDLAWSHLRLAALVPEGNRGHYGDMTDRSDPVKAVIATADTPEVVLFSLGTSDANMHATSCTSKIARRYSFVVSTGDFRLHPFLYEIEWALVCALANWQSTLTALTWEGHQFVKKTQFIDVTEGFKDTERNRNIRGWSAAWMCEVEMHFITSKLIEQVSIEPEEEP